MTNKEKRIYPRLTLGLGDGYFGNFTLNGGESLMAQITTISAGGTNLSFLNHIKAEIRWAKRLDKPGYVSVGCTLLDLSEVGREQLVQFVDAERIARGQYN